MRTNEGHRQRVKNRFIKDGLEHFEESHALELLLFYAVPRKDTKPLARRLLDRFGSFAKVLEADREQLLQVEGVGSGVATYLQLLNETNRYYWINRETELTTLLDVDQCGRYLVNFFVGKNKEAVYLLCLDSKCKVLCCQCLSEGNTASVDVTVRAVTEAAFAVNAASVILAHNHPDGSLIPSEADVVATKRIAAMLEIMEIELVDHILVSGDRYSSMAQAGHYDPNNRHVLFG